MRIESSPSIPPGFVAAGRENAFALEAYQNQSTPVSRTLPGFYGAHARLDDDHARNQAGGDSFASHLYVDEALIATNRTLSPAATQAQRELSAGYLSWFEQPQFPPVEEQMLT